jgi:hypothetical protein
MDALQASDWCLEFLDTIMDALRASEYCLVICYMKIDVLLTLKIVKEN